MNTLTINTDSTTSGVHIDNNVAVSVHNTAGNLNAVENIGTGSIIEIDSTPYYPVYGHQDAPIDSRLQANFFVNQPVANTSDFGNESATATSQVSNIRKRTRDDPALRANFFVNNPFPFQQEHAVDRAAKRAKYSDDQTNYYAQRLNIPSDFNLAPSGAVHPREDFNTSGYTVPIAHTGAVLVDDISLRRYIPEQPRYQYINPVQEGTGAHMSAYRCIIANNVNVGSFFVCGNLSVYGFNLLTSKLNFTAEEEEVVASGMRAMCGFVLNLTTRPFGPRYTCRTYISTEARELQNGRDVLDSLTQYTVSDKSYPYVLNISSQHNITLGYAPRDFGELQRPISQGVYGLNPTLVYFTDHTIDIYAIEVQSFIRHSQRATCGIIVILCEGALKDTTLYKISTFLKNVSRYPFIKVFVVDMPSVHGTDSTEVRLRNYVQTYANPAGASNAVAYGVNNLMQYLKLFSDRLFDKETSHLYSKLIAEAMLFELNRGRVTLESVGTAQVELLLRAVSSPTDMVRHVVDSTIDIISQVVKKHNSTLHDYILANDMHVVNILVHVLRTTIFDGAAVHQSARLLTNRDNTTHMDFLDLCHWVDLFFTLGRFDKYISILSTNLQGLLYTPTALSYPRRSIFGTNTSPLIDITGLAQALTPIVSEIIEEMNMAVVQTYAHTERVNLYNLSDIKSHLTEYTLGHTNRESVQNSKCSIM